MRCWRNHGIGLLLGLFVVPILPGGATGFEPRLDNACDEPLIDEAVSGPSTAFIGVESTRGTDGCTYQVTITHSGRQVSLSGTSLQFARILGIDMTSDPLGCFGEFNLQNTFMDGFALAIASGDAVDAVLVLWEDEQPGTSDNEIVAVSDGPWGKVEFSNCGEHNVDTFEILVFDCTDSMIRFRVGGDGFFWRTQPFQVLPFATTCVKTPTGPSAVQLVPGTPIASVSLSPTNPVAWFGTIQVRLVTGTSVAIASVGLTNPPCGAFDPSVNPLVTECQANPLLCCVGLALVSTGTPDDLACLRRATLTVDLNGDGFNEVEDSNALTVTHDC